MRSSAQNTLPPSSPKSPSCDSLIKACDTALADKQAQIDVRDKELSQAQIMLDSDTKELESMKRSDNAIYNQKWVWVVIGAVGAGFIIKH